jgi:hypothetical protein
LFYFQGILIARDHIVDATNQNYYFLIAAFYVAATVTSNMALKWVSFPIQVVAKGKLKVDLTRAYTWKFQ